MRWLEASLADCLRFWRMHAVARCCERLGIALPMLQPRSMQFEAWLWQHERRRQLKQQAAALFKRMCLRRCFGERLRRCCPKLHYQSQRLLTACIASVDLLLIRFQKPPVMLIVCLVLVLLLLLHHLCSYSPESDAWRAHGFKVRAMKAAWSGLVLHSSAELLQGGMSAFKANWREQQLQRALLAGCVSCWQGLARKYMAAAVMRQRIKEVCVTVCMGSNFVLRGWSRPLSWLLTPHACVAHALLLKHASKFGSLCTASTLC
jgi:hypothetical protein